MYKYRIAGPIPHSPRDGELTAHCVSPIKKKWRSHLAAAVDETGAATPKACRGGLVSEKLHASLALTVGKSVNLLKAKSRSGVLYFHTLRSRKNRRKRLHFKS